MKMATNMAEIETDIAQIETIRPSQTTDIARS